MALSSRAASLQAQKLAPVPHVVGLCILRARRHEAHGALAEVIEPVPDHGRYVDAARRRLEPKSALRFAVGKVQSKAARHRKYELLGCMVRVATPLHSRGDAVYIKNACDGERDVVVA